MSILSYAGAVVVRVMTHYQQHRRWFSWDKPNREAMGYREGLYPQNYSAADKERLGLKEPGKPKPCAWKAEHGYCDCARMLRKKE